MEKTLTAATNIIVEHLEHWTILRNAATEAYGPDDDLVEFYHAKVKRCVAALEAIGWYES